jgi:phosphatidylglycerophosphate synthase
MRLASFSPSSPTLMREARWVVACSLAIGIAAALSLVLGGAVHTLPAAAGLMLFVALLAALPGRLAGHHPHRRLGAANRITLVRAGVACLIAARAIDPAPLGTAQRWLLAVLAAAALLLDGADGRAARQQGTASAFGARFDMEVDAFAILVLAAAVAKTVAVPCWVLAIGAMRYLHLVAATALPALRRPLPARPAADRRRKTIAVGQSVALTLALAPATPPLWAATVCAAALALLAYSFGADIAMLARPGRSPMRISLLARATRPPMMSAPGRGEAGARVQDHFERGA